MHVLLVEQYETPDSGLGAIILQGGYRLLGPACGLDEALHLSEGQSVALALVRLSRTAPADSIRIAVELGDILGLPSLLIGGDSEAARSGRPAARGHIALPCSTDTILLGIATVLRMAGGRVPIAMPTGLELF
ncbi:hypothetical protein [Sphingomonas oryzagri]